MEKSVVGVIGGSGLYDLPGLTEVEDVVIDGPFGSPSDHLRCGQIGSTRVVFLPRHGRGHRIAPSGINYRANIDALKRLGVTDLVSVSACGSFRENLPPGTLLLPDQFIDRTFRRESSFFGTGCVAHVSMAHPVSPTLQDQIVAAAARLDRPINRGGTYVCIEGPQFSSFAESVQFRNSGCDVIGMTAMPEAKLAREAEISYAVIAMVTDFDCWHPDHDHVSVSDVVRVMHTNVDRVRALLHETIRNFPERRLPCAAGSHLALEHAIMTAPAARDPLVLSRLDAVAARILRRQE